MEGKSTKRYDFPKAARSSVTIKAQFHVGIAGCSKMETGVPTVASRAGPEG